MCIESDKSTVNFNLGCLASLAVVEVRGIFLLGLGGVGSFLTNISYVEESEASLAPARM